MQLFFRGIKYATLKVVPIKVKCFKLSDGYD